MENSNGTLCLSYEKDKDIDININEVGDIDLKPINLKRSCCN